MKIGYLTSQYPMVSCTFITREIFLLRELGFEIKTISINKPIINFEPEEEKVTYYVKESSFFEILSSFSKRLVKSPLNVFSGLKKACSLGFRSSLVYHLFYLLEAFLVADWAEKNEISHIHVHFMNNSSTIALLAKELTPISISFTVHGPDSFKNCETNFFEEKVHAANFVVCISDYAKSQVMNLVPYEDWKKLHVVRLGVNADKFKPQISKKPSKTLQLLSVGRLTPAKGQHLILEALEVLTKDFENIHLTFVGDGPDRKSLESEVKEKGLSGFVTFTGALSESDTREYFQKSDIFLLPSFAEGLPVVLMEAMAVELPCVTTYIAGIPELVENGANGILVAPGNVEGIVTGLAKLINDPQKRCELGRTARKKVIEQYSIDVNTRILAQLFKKQIGA